MKSLLDIISFGKLRVSYGLNGNVSGIGAYDLQGGYSTYSYGGYNGFLLNYAYNSETARYDIQGLQIQIYDGKSLELLNWGWI